MSLAFECPVGAVADVKELEYIAALHQTDHSKVEEFIDASIEASDIKYFLMSRYGIKTDKEQVRKKILSGLGGGDSDEDCIDILELVAILLIPMFLKISRSSEGHSQPQRTRQDFFSSREWKAYLDYEKALQELKPPITIISDVLRIILTDSTTSDKPQRLTPELLRRFFAVYGEEALVDDDNLIQEMIQSATGGDPDANLDFQSFTRALVNDVELYNTDNEKRFTTHFEDVFGDGASSVSSGMNRVSIFRDDDEEDSRGGTAIIQKPPMAFTFSEIDFTAETFRTRAHVVLVWMSLIIGYVSYFFQRGEVVSICDSDSFGCQIGQGIFNWTVIMGVLCIIGCAYVMVLSFGNSTYHCNIYDILLGILGIAFFIFLPFFLEFDAELFRTEKETVEGETRTYDYFLYYAHFILGCLLLILQLLNLIRLFIPNERMNSSRKLSAFFTGSNTKAEFRIKQAAIFKTNQMVKRAYELHLDDTSKSELSGNSSLNSSSTVTLLNFTKILEERETVGGFVWAWKRFFSGALYDREGIWFHSRLLAGNLAQGFITIVILVMGIVLTRYVVDEIYGDSEPDVDVSFSSDCISEFDPNLCVYPSTEVGLYVGVAVCTVSFQGSGCNNWLPVADSEAATKACRDLSTLYKEDVDDICSELSKPGHTIWSKAEASTGEYYCAAPVSICMPDVWASNETFLKRPCVLGADRLSFPFKFEGDACKDTPEIRLLLLQRKAVEDTEDKYKPEKWMVTLSMSIGTLFAFLGGIALTVVYIPSTASTVLRFRRGVIPSLRDPNFPKYRETLEDITFLLGTIFWGVLFTAFASIFIFGGLTFFFCWQFTRDVVVKILAIIIGIGVTIIFKSLIVKVLGRLNYAAFYRKRPVIANVAGLALECWHLGLTSGYMLARTVKMIICAALFVGRIDRPFLADGVGQIGPVDLDKFPMIFRKDLLSADAHRHPYIERLGTMYLMKLRFGEEFGKRSGSIWRLLFVFALMPWLRKYRILGDSNLPESAILHKLAFHDSGKNFMRRPIPSSSHDKDHSQMKPENGASRQENNEPKENLLSDQKESQHNNQSLDND